MPVSGTAYPFYKIADGVIAFEDVLPRAIAKINPLYFETNPRFKGIRRIASSSLVDYLGIYEEGNWWVLTIVEVVLEDRQAKYLFLPLTAQASGAEVALRDRLPAGIVRPAFGLQTSSEFYGVRNWKMVDAFTDFDFCQKMFFLFLPWENVPETHINAYLDFHEGGHGKFSFHANGDLQTWWNESDAPLEISIEFTEGNELVLHYGDAYRLSVCGIVSDADPEMFTQSSEVAGWITYQGAQKLELLIGVLSKQ